MLAEGVQVESRSHTTSLPALVDRVLADTGVTIADVEGLAVSIGPGSFTGLRIGLALAKGIAFAGGLPLVGVPTLEALAHVADASPGEAICGPGSGGSSIVTVAVVLNKFEYSSEPMTPATTSSLRIVWLVS